MHRSRQTTESSCDRNIAGGRRWLELELWGLQVLVKVLYTGINGGCETFRARGDRYTP